MGEEPESASSAAWSGTDVSVDANLASQYPSIVASVPEPMLPVRISASQLSGLRRLSQQMVSIECVTTRLQVICALMMSAEFRAKTAVALRVREDAAPVILATWCRDDEPGPDMHISSVVTRALLETRDPVLGTQSAPETEGAASRDVRKLSGAHLLNDVSVVACPLEQHDDGAVDVLYAEVPLTCGTLDWLSLISLVAEAYRQSNLIWSSRREVRAFASTARELEMARQIQRAFIPKLPKSSGLELSVGFHPSELVGGDYVDVLEMADGRTLLVIADVCGKGLHAAMVASAVHTMVHASVEAGAGPAHLMARLNDHLCDFLPDHSFVTATCVAVDSSTGELECYNAGHLPPLVVSELGVVRRLPAGVNLALGILREGIAPSWSKLEPGEWLLLYTDGLADGHGQSESLGIDVIEALVSELVSGKGATVAEVGRRLSALAGDARDQRDDCTYLVARRAREARGRHGAGQSAAQGGKDSGGVIARQEGVPERAA